MNIYNKQIQDFVCDTTSYFAIYVIDAKTHKIIFHNKAMKNIMVYPNESKCFKALFGENSECSWCPLKNKDKALEYEHFNEYTNLWYKIQSRSTKLDNGQEVLVSVAIDISNQKEAQGHLINTQVKLTQEAEKLKKVQKELKLLASTDPMTKLYNRRFFLEASEKNLSLAKRDNEALSTIIMDIDNFKSINDTYGHEIGDEVIILLANRLNKLTRKSDISSRFGGEEFVILLPKTDLDGAFVIAEKIRKNIQDNNMQITEDINLKFTISLGISQVDLEHDYCVSECVNRADKALYEAKKSGKNRTCIN
jgi:diguanylate cyclase (GGDEF)-like protein